MRILFYNPPNVPSVARKGNWVVREFKHSGATYRYGTNPFSILLMAGHIASIYPEAEIVVRDGRMSEESPEEFHGYLQRECFDVIVVFIGAFTITHDLRFAPRLSAAVTIGCVMPVTIPLEELIRVYDPQFDILTAEYPIDSVCEILAVEERTEDKQTILSTARGTYYRWNGEWHKTARVASPTPWGALGPTGFRFVDMSEYRRKMESRGISPSALYQGQIGCENACKFCTQSRTAAQYLPATRVVDDLEILTGAGYEDVCFMDNEFAVDIERAKDICDQIVKRGLRIRWSCQNYVEWVDDRLYEMMAQAGCYEVRYGIETADPAVKEVIGKTYKNESVLLAFALGRKYGIYSTAYLMFGLPKESREGYLKTFDLMKRAQCTRFSANVFFPSPGCDLYWKIKNEGRLLCEDWTEYKSATRPIIEYDDDRTFRDVQRDYRWFNRKMLRHINWSVAAKKRALLPFLVCLIDEFLFLPGIRHLKDVINEKKLYYAPLVNLNLFIDKLRKTSIYDT